MADGDMFDFDCSYQMFGQNGIYGKSTEYRVEGSWIRVEVGFMSTAQHSTCVEVKFSQGTRGCAQDRDTSLR